MMMNERVEVTGAKNVTASTRVDEMRVRLHQRLKRIAKARAHLDLQEAEALREAQKVQLWKEFGHTSLVDYMVNELGYCSWRTAEDRLRLANALPELPKLAEAIQTGNLSMSQARELVRVATPETEEKWIAKALDLNVRQVEQAVTGHSKGDLPEDPVDPRLVRKTMYMSVRPETEVLFREARKALEAERGERFDDDAVLEALCLAILRPATRAERAYSTHVGDDFAAAVSSTGGQAVDNDVRVVSSDTEANVGTHVGGAGAAYRVAVTVCGECKRGWQHGAGAVVDLSPPAVDRATCDAQWIGNLDSMLVERARQEISPATRRKVLHRDSNRCRVPGCQSHTNLDIHHILHRANGGTNDLWNLITLCEAHHLAHHDGTLRITRDGDDITFTRQASNRFTRTTREVSTREELRRRGYTREQVVAIMARTINTIGDTAATEEHWLAIALRAASDHAS